MPTGFWHSLSSESCNSSRMFRVGIFTSNIHIGPKSSLQKLRCSISALELPFTCKPEARTGYSTAAPSASLVRRRQEADCITVSHNKSADFRRYSTLLFEVFSDRETGE